MLTPHIVVSEAGPTFHFSHANGYPPMSYDALLSPFKDRYSVIASLHRPLWPNEKDPESFDSWETLGSDIVNLTAELDRPVVSIGHSMGSAAILMAAVQKPEYFRKIVLIEPVLIPRYAPFFLKKFPSFAKRRWPLARQTINRVDRWGSREAAFEHYRPKAVFKRISDDVLWDYINAGVTINNHGEYELTFTKEWELQCYLKVHNCWSLFKNLKVPVLIIRGSKSNTLSKRTWGKLKNIAPNNKYIEVPDCGHLVPFERPEIVASHISAWVNS